MPSNKKVPGEAYSPHIHARFWLTQNEAYVGIGRITLLEAIDEHGSINAAAKSMGMSYKKAWKLIDEMNQMFNKPLVIKEHGGKAGGGTQLTDQGRGVITAFRKVEQQLTDYLQQASQELGFK